MTTGVVKWFQLRKGFGFIQPTDGGPDVFVHISAVERAGLRGLNEGQKVSFELVPTSARARLRPAISRRLTRTAPRPGLQSGYDGDAIWRDETGITRIADVGASCVGPEPEPTQSCGKAVQRIGNFQPAVNAGGDGFQLSPPA